VNEQSEEVHKEHKSYGPQSAEVMVHKMIARQCHHGIVELGVLFGETTKVLLENSNVPVYGIDPLIPDSMNPRLIGSEKRIKENTREHAGRFTFIKDYSYNVVKNFKGKFDYLFLDASHLYNDVKRDFEEWFPLLSPAGYISLHDSAAGRGGPDNWSGPSRLALELLYDPRVNHIGTIYSLTVFMKT